MAVVAAEARKAGRPLPPWQFLESVQLNDLQGERQEPNTTKTELNPELILFQDPNASYLLTFLFFTSQLESSTYLV